MLAIKTIDARKDWDSLFEKIAHPPLLQSWFYGEALSKQTSWPVHRYAIYEDDNPLCIFQCLHD